ncbi:cysteine desulfurase family protein [Clostridiisalibacter paucivorans]|uniref:cysteine desulfurase family protein n=1 Tax=Clostridiisalibacter paucivorans TaxID=408753 RepID=UPI0004793A40|nr:cysteine desulfurase family protein [Clostridiisalibacter paucivorans]
MEVYLDNSATTKPREEVIDAMNYMQFKCFGNPSSLHRMGLNAEKKIKESRKIISEFLKVKSDEIYFTSGGTESNNIAIQGIINRFSKQGKHIITSHIEHPSVLNVFKKYESNGYKVTYLKVDKNGLIDLRQLENSITDETILISVMAVNNEVGTIQPLKYISDIIKRKKESIKFHVDAVQGFGKIELYPKTLNIDTLSFSGHKIHGPKGIGGLYIKKGLNLNPMIYGGNQEWGIRSGTENTPGIVGLGKAVDIIKDSFDTHIMKMKKIKKYFIEKALSEIKNININGFIDDNSAPHIVNISFNGIRGEVLLHYLEQQGIYVSTGSACSSKGKRGSHVLRAMGLDMKKIEGAIRFSFSQFNTEKDIDYTIDKLKESVEDIRQITMR